METFSYIVAAYGLTSLLLGWAVAMTWWRARNVKRQLARAAHDA